MKAFQKTVLASLLVLSAGQAMAADSIDVKVIGTITPSACAPQLSGGATIDYGIIPASKISQDDFTVLKTQDLTFSINCDAPTKVALKSTDTQKSTVVNPVGATLLGGPVDANSPLAGLGQTDDSKNIGAYAMQIVGSTVKLDAGSAQPDGIYSMDSGTQWTKANQYGAWLTDNARLSSWASVGETTPVAFSTMTGTLRVQAAINKGSELNLTKDIKLNGLTTLELVYL